MHDIALHISLRFRFIFRIYFFFQIDWPTIFSNLRRTLVFQNLISKEKRNRIETKIKILLLIDVLSVTYELQCMYITGTQAVQFSFNFIFFHYLVCLFNLIMREPLLLFLMTFDVVLANISYFIIMHHRHFVIKVFFFINLLLTLWSF